VAWYPTPIALAWFAEVWISARVDPAAALRGLLLTLVIALAVTLVVTIALGRERGGLAGAIMVVGLIGTRDVLTAIPFLAAVPLLLVERRWAAAGRMRLPWPRIHEGLTVIAVVMLVIQVGRLVTIDTPGPKLEPSAWSGTSLSTGSRPNIYVILADAHARHDILLDWYGYDDTPVLDALESLGFDVAPASRSNYLLTRFSLASMFTSSYLTEIHDGRSYASADAFASNTISNNPAFPLLGRAGYEVVVVSSGYEHLGLRGADRFIDTGQLNELEDSLLASTALGRLAFALKPDLALQAIRDRTIAQLELLPRLADDPDARPRFVFMHLPVPHWPYAFDADCGPARPSAETDESNLRLGSSEQVRLVRDQTICADRLVGAAVAALVARDPGAVVILMSDHGPQEYFDPVSPSDDELNERSANLFAARTPGHPGLYPDDITLVNVLPILFNAYLGTDLPLQPNRTWFGPSARDGSFTPVAPEAP
jgi:hypothetical protein